MSQGVYKCGVLSLFVINRVWTDKQQEGAQRVYQHPHYNMEVNVKMKKQRFVYSVLALEVIQGMLIFFILKPIIRYMPSAYDARAVYGDQCRAFRHIFYQGDCGACAAFATASSIGMRGCKKGYDFIPSPHRLFDCANATCDRGAHMYSMHSVLLNGVPDVINTPAMFSRGCVTGNITTKQFTGVCGSRYIKSHILTDGPMVFSIPVSDDFAFYSNTSHIYIRPPGDFDVGHAVVVFGWDDGDAHTGPSWLIQNSWSEQWGTAGIGRVDMSMLDCMVGFNI